MPNLTQPGYFRIGSVILQIPPCDISTNRVVNDDQVPTLRSSTPMFIKSGQARWDVTVHWKAIREVSDGGYDYSQWQDLRRIVATFKASPFVEVENDFLRQHFTDVEKSYKQQRMAFALKQLRIETNPDTTNLIDVTLTMSLFNFSPFSIDFAYTGGDDNNTPVDATDSTAYNFFLDHWMTTNMDTVQNPLGEPALALWNEQEEGTMTIKWRKYLYVPFDNPPPQSATRAPAGYSPTVPPPKVPLGQSKGRLSNAIQEIVNRKAKQYGLDPAIVSAQCWYESKGRPNAVSRTGAIGLMQLLPSTARQLGVANPLDPEQNLDGGCKYLAEQLRRFGNYPHALGAYNAGAGYILAYRDGRSIKVRNSNFTINSDKVKTADGLPPAGIPHGENVPKYVSTIMADAGLSKDIVIVPPKGEPLTPPKTPTDNTIIDIPNPGVLACLNTAVQNLPDPEPGNIWLLDHYHEKGAYFFQEENLYLANEDSSTPSDYDLFPNQISVVMVNNLPLIPLANMQYPTYQHVGPTDTIISISMNSIGIDSDVLSEPEHPGVQALVSVSNQLEEQFHNLRTNFRAVSSIHRMQAVYIENQILNMLGIRGTMLRGVNTETVDVNLVQVSLMASQYENIFEENPPFRINGLPEAYKSALSGLLTNGSLNKVSVEEQNALALVREFGNAWHNHDEAYLLKKIFSITKEPINYLVGANTLDAGLRPDQKLLLLSSLDLSTGPSTIIKGLPGASQFQKDIYPGLELRRRSLQRSTTGMTYADYYVFTRLPLLSNDVAIANIRSSVDPKFAAKKSDMLEAMYQRLFDLELLTNAAFSRQAKVIANSPAFKKLTDNQVTVDGPSLQPENEGHFCYKDLGLTDYRQDPAGYFVNYNEIISKGVTSRVESILKTANDTANQANESKVANPKADQSQGFVWSGDPKQNIPPTSASRMINVPGYSMNSAFPTFKLMLIEEDNTGPFFAFDNFYSYSSVIDIEVIKYSDKPDTAIIQITNLFHTLNHRLYDDTAAGKLEATYDRFNTDQFGTISGPNVDLNESGTGGLETSGITGGKTAAGTLYRRVNFTEGRGEEYSRVPLKYFALQTGSKIQVRMGYSNNPDNLFPVFTGQVTEIEGDAVLTLTCQSFQLELMTVPGTTVAKNSAFGWNVVSGQAALGGWSLSNAGNTGSVIEKMLKSHAARHFGHWQIGGIKDPLLKGFNWTELVGQLGSNSSDTTIAKVAALLQTGYDRSAENIMINSVVNYDATKSPKDPANAGRRLFDENTSWLQHYLRLGTAAYSIPKQSELSVWDIVKDVSRRYPHYNLLVKDYGFPYGADATLVYASPLDWYYTRPPLYNDAEKEKPNNVTQGQQFQSWWNSTGRAKWNDVWAHAWDSNPILGVIIRDYLLQSKSQLDSAAGSGPEGFVGSIQQIHGILSGTTANAPTDGALNKLFHLVQNIGTNAVLSGNLTQGVYQHLDANFQELLREWEVHLILSDPASNSSRIKPVRKFHLIDHSHIVHNGITVNGSIYNAVKVLDEAPLLFNQNIPPQHTRTLNVTEMINDPQNNCDSSEMRTAYAQSFLREEVGKMYRGELILRGVPEIEPMDVLLLMDMSTGMIGGIEVETVIHSFNLENGYVTIVKPRLLVIANESVSMNFIRALGFAASNAMSELYGLGYTFNPTRSDATATTVLASAAIVAGGAATVALGAWLLPVGALVAGLGLLSGYGIIVGVDAQQDLNFFKIQPLSKFGRPWVGGLEGFRISDFSFSVKQGLDRFDAEEIAPTIESWNELLHYRMDYIPSK